MNKAEKAKAYREELKAEGYCPRCYKRKAVAGKLHCKECEKYYFAYYHAHKAQRLEYAKQRREKLKAAGLCTQCGKRQPVTFHWYDMQPDGQLYYATSADTGAMELIL